MALRNPSRDTIKHFLNTLNCITNADNFFFLLDHYNAHLCIFVLVIKFQIVNLWKINFFLFPSKFIKGNLFFTLRELTNYLSSCLNALKIFSSESKSMIKVCLINDLSSSFFPPHVIFS